MYCENCGKKLEDGEVCSCQKPAVNKKRKKKSKIQINIYMLISFLLFVLGIEMFLYFYIGVENFLEVIPIDFIKENERYFSCGIIIFICLFGSIAGILTIKNKTARKASVIALAVNSIYFLLACVVLGKTVYDNHVERKSIATENVAQEEDTVFENENQNLKDAKISDEEDKEQFIQTVIANADNLIQEGNIDKAKAILSDAYAVTKSEEIQNKLNGLSGQEDISQEEPAQMVSSSEEENKSFSTGIHRYDFILMDGTWEDAYRACIERGGHLVTFESREEFTYVSAQLLDRNLKDDIFFIGGRRSLDSQNYYWVDDSNNFIGSVLNSPDAWNSGCWYSNEPSFNDSSSGAAEHVLSIFFHADSNQWVWNDVPNDLVNVVPYYSGKIGYICEYEC